MCLPAEGGRGEEQKTGFQRRSNQDKFVRLRAKRGGEQRERERERERERVKHGGRGTDVKLERKSVAGRGVDKERERHR